MRRDNGVTDPVVFSFYRGFSYNATGGTELLGSFTNTTVASGGAGYSPALVTITPTANLTQGAYSFTLTSNAVSNSSYNLKGQASDPPELLDATTGTLVSTTYFANAGANPTPYPSPTPGPTPVPEPRQVLAALLTAAGIGICLVLNHRRNRIEVLRRFTPAS